MFFKKLKEPPLPGLPLINRHGLVNCSLVRVYFFKNLSFAPAGITVKFLFWKLFLQEHRICFKKKKYASIIEAQCNSNTSIGYIVYEWKLLCLAYTLILKYLFCLTIIWGSYVVKLHLKVYFKKHESLRNFV